MSPATPPAAPPARPPASRPPGGGSRPAQAVGADGAPTDFASLLAAEAQTEPAPRDGAGQSSAAGDEAASPPPPPPAAPPAPTAQAPAASPQTPPPAPDEAGDAVGTVSTLDLVRAGSGRTARVAADAAEPQTPGHEAGPAPGAPAGELALNDISWQLAAHHAAAAPAVAPVVPVVPSADGALPSLVAPGEAGAASAPTAPTPAAEPAVPQAHLPQQPGSEAFTQALGQQLRTWLRSGVAHARLSLNPADLGPIDVRIAVSAGRAQVDLAAPVASTREALLQALPVLTQQLGGAGLALSGGQVGDGRAQQGGAQDPAPAQARAAWAGEGAASAGPGRPPAGPGRGLVDLYA